MIFVPIIVVVIFAIAFAPTSGSRRSYRRRKSKGFFGEALKPSNLYSYGRYGRNTRRRRR